MTSTAAAPQPGTRVRVVADAYGTFAGQEGTVVPEPPEISRTLQPDTLALLDGTVWVLLDGWGDDAVRDGYNRPPAPGFDPAELEVLS